jgi:hypothetical protein
MDIDKMQIRMQEGWLDISERGDLAMTVQQLEA